MSRILAGLTIVLSAALPAAAVTQGVVDAVVNGSSVGATVSLPGGFGADVTLSFENVTGLNLTSLGVSAQLINPTDPALLARLPAGSVPLAFPVLLRIEPPAAGGLSFRGITSLDVHTHNLQYIAGCPLRIYSAHAGEPFKDITASMGAGSYRVRGTEGGFSDFLIVADTRPVDQVIQAKLGALDEELNEYAGSLPGPLYNDLSARLAAVRDDIALAATAAAVQEIDGFLAVVQQHSGTDIPDVWRAARDVENVAGYLRAGAMTLRFSLGLKSGLGL
ncbi:MAG: hypothetical protein DMF53_05135 [Acidobacteria bacterium]|nr:MAG: hypothetical protein DMF53_05135 [Acidobacteriota bacterium]